MKIRVGLVGLGDQWQSRHRPALLALSDRFEVKAICCEVAERSKIVAKEFNAIALDGFRAMIERQDIDAVFALAPDWVGHLPILAASEAGKAVYCSTALDISPDQAKEIRERIDRAGVAFMAEFPRRYAPATLRLKELIATRLGRPKLLFCHDRMPVESQLNRLRRGDYCPLVWRHIMEQVDWCRYIVGEEPESVMSAGYKNFDCDESFYQMVSLQFPANSNQIAPLAQLSLGHYIPASWADALTYRRPASIQVCCENGMAFLDLPSTLVWFDDGGQHTESLESEKPIGEQMLSQFYRSVTSLVRKQADLNDAYRAMQIVLNSNKSIETGKRISVEFG
ncbi:MAG: Gfo/Idh/MocA family oxidoreductase [Planctomycetota bacterium]